MAAHVVDHAGRQLAGREAANAHRVLRIAVQEIGGTVERIDDPHHVATRRLLGRQLLPDDHAVRDRATQLLGDQGLGRAVDLRDVVVLRLFGPGVDRRPGRAAQIVARAQCRALRELD
jgi:hypothetical protein